MGDESEHARLPTDSRDRSDNDPLRARSLGRAPDFMPYREGGNLSEAGSRTQPTGISKMDAQDVDHSWPTRGPDPASKSACK